uniref:Ubiquitin-like protease family profile domain-containing protein n=1 Tax=Aegilops tauschii TaxID=37682 RepID=M8CU53_AEGTA
MHEVNLRRIMLVRLAKSIDSDTQSITISKMPIPITKENMHCIYGIPIEGGDVEPHLQRETGQQLFTAYANKGQILISDLEKAIRASKAPDDDFLRWFILYAVGVVLAPTPQRYVDLKFLNLVEDLENLRKFNWGCFTLNHLFKSIHKFTHLDQVSLQGNLILLQTPSIARTMGRKLATLRSDAYEKEGLHNGLMDMIFEAGHEKKVGRKLMETEHRFDAKYITMSEDLINIKSKTGSNPRLSKAEDEIKDLRRELHELKYQFTSSRQSVSQKAGVQEQVNVCNSSLTATPRVSECTVGTSTTPIARHVTQNNEEPRLTPMRPVFDNDYKFTKEDIETVVFIHGTYNPVEIARIGDISLTAEKLKRNLSNQYICDDVIMAYARISQIENDTTSIISPHETDKLLQTKEVVPDGRGASWVGRLAEKFVGRLKVHVPLNVHQKHWMLMMFNFDKEEIQIVNSLNNHCDKTNEDSLEFLCDTTEHVVMEWG